MPEYMQKNPTFDYQHLLLFIITNHNSDINITKNYFK